MPTNQIRAQIKTTGTVTLRIGSKGHGSADGKKHVRVGDEVAPSFVGTQARNAARGDSRVVNKKQYQSNKVKQKQPTLTIDPSRITKVDNMQNQ